MPARETCEHEQVSFLHVLSDIPRLLTGERYTLVNRLMYLASGCACPPGGLAYRQQSTPACNL